MQKQKLTGWLILFIVWLGLSSVNGLGSLDRIAQSWKPLMANYPSLHGAVTLFQFFLGAGMIAWLYTAWVLYEREPGSLKSAQYSLLAGAGLRLIGTWSIVLFGGLPVEKLQTLMSQTLISTCGVLVFSGVWYYYLVSSARVRQIYAAFPTG
ncbi:MAG TPA: DUF2569 family protein [Dongiaceae bacterium]|jgi:hypothetical protein|nr:DUF2569 family protein [Dongiaceae bacterium]